MPSETPKQQRFFYAVKQAKHNPGYGDSRLHKVADSMTDSDIDDFTKLKAELKMKKALLGVLKELRDPMYLEELVASKGTDGEIGSESDIIVKKFTVEGKYEDYIKRFLGQKFSEKEQEAFNTFHEKKPVKRDSDEVRYETTDDFNNSTTTVVKKLREGGDFVYVAFKKTTKSETTQNQPQQPPGGGLGGGIGAPPLFEMVGENKFKLHELAPNPPMGADPLMGGGLGQPPMGGAQPAPGVGPMTTTAPMTGTPKSSDQKKKEMGIDDIEVIKSTTFKDDIKGGAILVEFLKQLKM